VFGNTGYHYFTTPEETERARAAVAARTAQRAQDAADAQALVEAISTLPQGKQGLCRRLLAHVASSHTSRKTKVRALTQLAIETGAIRSTEVAQLAATYPSTIHAPTLATIEASALVGEEVSP